MRRGGLGESPGYRPERANGLKNERCIRNSEDFGSKMGTSICRGACHSERSPVFLF